MTTRGMCSQGRIEIIWLILSIQSMQTARMYELTQNITRSSISCADHSMRKTRSQRKYHSVILIYSASLLILQLLNFCPINYLETMKRENLTSTERYHTHIIELMVTDWRRQVVRINSRNITVAIRWCKRGNARFERGRAKGRFRLWDSLGGGMRALPACI